MASGMAPRQPTPSFLPLRPDAGDPAPPPEAPTVPAGGNSDAVQNDGPGADRGSPGAVRAAPEQQAAAAGPGCLRDRAESQPPSVDASPPPGQSAQRHAPDRQQRNGAGDSVPT